MRLYSTNGGDKPVTFREAALRGLADDGGLFMPVEIPALPGAFWERCGAMPFAEIAQEMAFALVGDEIPREALRGIVRDAFNFDAPLVELAPDLFILELFHGPTLAFKDFGARFMARTLAYLRREEARDLTVLVATSGDTGSAVAHGFHNVAATRVVVLYPSGQVSRAQEQQLTTLGGNVSALEVRGTFDDCQRMVKAAFRDPEIRARLELTSANSINIARLLPQAFYYVWAFAQSDGARGGPVFAVPSGNFGNLTAGLIARRMGLPARHFIAATNVNDVVPGYLADGVFAPRASLQTLSSAMDVGDPSNFARMLALFDGGHALMASAISGYRFTDAETLDGMRELYDTYGYVVDPHTAVGYLGSRAYVAAGGAAGMRIVLATAHPAKFAAVCREALGMEVELPEALRGALEKPKQATLLSATDEALRAFLLA
jgi:threonine synthase